MILKVESDLGSDERKTQIKMSTRRYRMLPTQSWESDAGEPKKTVRHVRVKIGNIASNTTTCGLLILNFR